jgi:hypothetical protein
MVNDQLERIPPNPLLFFFISFPAPPVEKIHPPIHNQQKIKNFDHTHNLCARENRLKTRD